MHTPLPVGCTCFRYKLSGSSDTSAAVSSCISNVVPSMHTDTLMSLLYSASTVCVLYTMKWSSHSSGDSSVTEHTRDLPSQTFELAVNPVLPQRKHRSYLNLQICGAFLPPQRQHCCPDACLPCFPYLLICQGYLPLLCFCANLTRLTFSLGYVPTVAPHGERNCCACCFTTVILTAISTER